MRRWGCSHRRESAVTTEIICQEIWGKVNSSCSFSRPTTGTTLDIVSFSCHRTLTQCLRLHCRTCGRLRLVSRTSLPLAKVASLPSVSRYFQLVSKHTTEPMCDHHANMLSSDSHGRLLWLEYVAETRRLAALANKCRPILEEPSSCWHSGFFGIRVSFRYIGYSFTEADCDRFGAVYMICAVGVYV